MSYYLKKTKLKKGLYLQIYEGHHDKIKGYTKSTLYRTIGYYNALVEQGIEDPIEYFKREVEELNLNLKVEKENEKANVRHISSESYLKNVGYFPLKIILEDLGVKNYIDLFQSIRGFKFNLFEMISALVYSRVIAPCSKLQTHSEILPTLFKNYNFSYDQILEGCEFIGSEYEKFVELFTAQVQKKYGINTKITYFDCTNFYFEIDREDSFRKNGPSKENRKCPIVGLGLLLDEDMIPIGMKMYPGNQSEKPVFREVLTSLKSRNNIKGRTISVADKGLNSAENIIKAIKECDGYIFSKSIKLLPETEKIWVLLNNDWHDVKHSDGSIYYSYKECIDKFPYTYTQEDGKKVQIELTEKRVVTYSPKLAQKQRYEILKMVEKARHMCASQAKRSEYGESSKYITFNKESDKKEKVIPSLNDKAVDADLALCGYNLMITSELNMSAMNIYSVYHNLWRIEESFKIMKSYLDARPVFLQKEDTIKGHFFICYVGVLLTRLLQFKKLGNRYGTPELVHFMKTYKIAKTGESEYFNYSLESKIIDALAVEFNIPLNNLLLSKAVLGKMKLLQ